MLLAAKILGDGQRERSLAHQRLEKDEVSCVKLAWLGLCVGELHNKNFLSVV